MSFELLAFDLVFIRSRWYTSSDIVNMNISVYLPRADKPVCHDVETGGFRNVARNSKRMSQPQREPLASGRIRYESASGTGAFEMPHTIQLRTFVAGEQGVVTMKVPVAHFRNANGNWNVPYTNWNGAKFNRNGNWLNNDWNSNYRVVLVLLTERFLHP